MRWIAALLLLAPQESPGWKPLFNGRDLEGWEVWVGPGKGHPARGLNNDPDGVFTVGEIDGAPAMHVTGQTIGAFTTKEEFDNFHFRVEFRWGEKTWGERKGLPRDSGIFYYCVGPHGAGSGAWMKSVQANIMEEDYGSFWGVAGSIIDVELGDERSAYREDPKHDYPVYRKGGKLTTRGPSGGDAVRPTPIPEPKPGSWNVAEVIAMNGTGIHVFNGQVTNVLRNARYKADGKLVPMTRGRIQLQSELAEIWFRKPEIRAIREFPRELRDWVDGPGGDEGFTPLLDDAHLKNWVHSGPGKFDVKDGVATGQGLWWYKAAPFKNFVLRGEFLQETAEHPDPGVWIRFPDPGNEPPAPAKASVFSFPGFTWRPLKPPGEWNSVEIACVGRTTDVRLNGHLVNRVVDEQRPLEGHVGLLNLPSDRTVRYRNLRIKELP
jgi:hypothetical protein